MLIHLNERNQTSRQNTVLAGPFKISIVGGEFLYSFPRKNCEAYSEVEIAFFDRAGEWASFNQLEKAGVFSILGEKGEYEDTDNPEGPSVSVFKYIKAETVARLLEHLQAENPPSFSTPVISGFTPKDGLKSSHRKENWGLDRAFILLDMAENAKRRELVEVRTYWKSETCYACAWVNGHSAMGSHAASGWGYDKREEAVRCALIKAGFGVSVSYCEPRDLLLEIAKYWGIERPYVVETHP